MLPEFEEEEDQDDYYFTNTLQSSASKGQSSLWSIFGQKNKPQSASLLSLDSNRSENLSELNYNNEWQGSSDSFDIDNRNLNKYEASDPNIYFADNEQYPKLQQATELELADSLPFEEVAEFVPEPQPQVLKARG